MIRATALIMLLVLAAGCGHAEPPVADAPRSRAPGPPFHVRVTGRDFRWHIRYPGPDGILDTADDPTGQRHLHLPADSDVRLELCSDDYVYSLYLPQYEMVEMAFPGRPFLVELATASPGTSRLMGSQMCGYTHEELLGDLIVQRPAELSQAINR